MLTYKITSHEPLPTLNKRQRRALKQKDPKFKEKLFAKLISQNRLKPGDRVRVVNTKRLGTVEEIVYNFNDVKWDGSYPQFIVVKFDDGAVEIGAPYTLTRKGV